MKCRHCKTKLKYTFLNLGFAPPSNAYLRKEDLNKPEKYFPLKIMVCNNCWLVQTEDYVKADEIFNPDYSYFSSTSHSYLTHAKKYTEKILQELKLDGKNFVIEIASNDGYLLKNFADYNIPCLGIEPTDGTASVAEGMGIPVLRGFFCEQLGKKLASEGKKADLIVGNNVYAHVPDIIDFTKGLKVLLNRGGTITLEFPHLMCLIEQTQFDTIYHEHFSYLSLHVVSRIFKDSGLRIWNVEELSTHGGSLRIYGCHEDDSRDTLDIVEDLMIEERQRGLQCLDTYLNFQKRVDKVKNNFLAFLIDQKKSDKMVAAYGAAAKGNTLLNYAGVKQDLLPFVCDSAKAKQYKYMPGSHIPIISPLELREITLDYLLILPWNIAKEIKKQNEVLIKKGTKFVTVVPELRIV